MQESVKINRNHYIGGSDIPAIMGISRFKSRYQLLRQKAELEDDTFTGNKYTEYGNILEPKIRDYINDKFDYHFSEARYIKDPFEYDATFDFPIRCHLDGLQRKTVLEIKTTGEEMRDLVTGETDDVVLRTTYKIYLVQTLFYMMTTGNSVGCIAVYYRPKDMNEEFDAERLHCYWFNMKDYIDIIDDITYEVKRFICDVQKLKENPFLSEEDFLPMDLKVIAQNLIYFEDVIAQYKKTIDEFEMLKSRMFEAMQNHSIESFRTDSGVLISAVAGIEPSEEIVS